MPARKDRDPTPRTTKEPQTPQKPAPLGTDVAFAMPGTGGEALNLFPDQEVRAVETREMGPGPKEVATEADAVGQRGGSTLYTCLQFAPSSFSAFSGSSSTGSEITLPVLAGVT